MGLGMCIQILFVSYNNNNNMFVLTFKFKFSARLRTWVDPRVWGE